MLQHITCLECGGINRLFQGNPQYVGEPCLCTPPLILPLPTIKDSWDKRKQPETITTDSTIMPSEIAYILEKQSHTTMTSSPQQGWQCPVCKKVNAPWVPGCSCHMEKK